MVDGRASVSSALMHLFYYQQGLFSAEAEQSSIYPEEAETGWPRESQDAPPSLSHEAFAQSSAPPQEQGAPSAASVERSSTAEDRARTGRALRARCAELQAKLEAGALREENQVLESNVLKMQEAGNAALESLAQATAGAGGGIFATVVLQPLEVVKTRISVSQHGGASIQETFREIIASEGFSALYSGLSAKCSETCLKNFVYFYVYDAIMRVAKQHRKITTALNLALGYVAGVVTTSSTMPLEVLSTRLQAEKGGGDGMVSLARRIIATEGIGGLFKAYWWNMLLCINPAIQNTVFDKMKANIIKVKAGGDVKLRVFLSPFEAFLLGALSKALAT
ncbi:unnamed protein product, partial [Polarella glacialis]